VRMTELVMTPEKVVRERHDEDVPCDRIRIFSLEGELFFGAAPELEQLLEGVADEMVEGGGRVVILRLKRARDPDAVCSTVVERFNERMHAANISVLLCGLRPEVTRVINSSGLLERLGRERVFVFEETGKFWTSTLEAVRFAYEIVGRNVCDTCPRRDE